MLARDGIERGDGAVHCDEHVLTEHARAHHRGVDRNALVIRIIVMSEPRLVLRESDRGLERPSEREQRDGRVAH